MQTEKIDEDLYDSIERFADKGDYLSAAVSLLTPNMQPAELATDASYLVVDSAYTLTIIRLDAEGRPVAILERD